MQNYVYQVFTCLIVLGLFASSAPLSAHANQNLSATQSTQISELQINSDAEGLVIRWDSRSQAVNAAGIQETTLGSFPQMRYGGYLLPMKLETVLVEESIQSAALHQDAGTSALLQIEKLDGIPYRTALTAAEPLKPKAIGWDEEISPSQEEPHLPTSPLFVLREGKVRGQKVAVVAFSPIYEEEGVVRYTAQLEAKISNAEVLKGGLAELFSRRASAVTASSFSTTNQPLAFTPTNPAVFQDAVKIHVSEPGIQLVTGVELINIGVPANTSLDSIKIARRGSEIAVEVWDSGSNGTLDAADSLRFFADQAKHSSTVGDFWNEQEIYWLTYSGSSGLRMANRNVTPGGSSTAPVSTVGREIGIWEDNLIYESRMQGVDGDNWFHAALTVGPASSNTNPNEYPEISVVLNNRLPLATSSNRPSHFTLTGSAGTVANHTLRVGLNSSSETVNWTNLQHFESWSQVISSTANHPQSLRLTLIPGALESDIHFDKIYWEQPVNLDFASQGAIFSGLDGIWRYQLANVASDAALYDITDPQKPTRLVIPAGTGPQFEDGPTPRRYILTTGSDLAVPTLSKHSALSWPTSTQAHVLYIGEQKFHNELQPLLDLRTAQGFKALAIDLQDVYDSWSFGQISPDAVRNLLQYAVNNWAVPPIAAIAVGDSTVDPKNYQGRLDGDQNKNIFPTFLEPNDPWLGETICESCFVQLDDLHPLDGIEDKDFLIDMWFGRLSIQDETQLFAVVSKIINYETSNELGLDARWRQTSVFIADNYVRLPFETPAEKQTKCSLDSAGDFASAADEIIEHYQHPNMITTRIYYDPSTQVDPSCPYYANSFSKPGRYATPDAIQSAALNAYKSGAGLITFDGHSNHFFNGRIENGTEQGQFIFGFNDILQMNNGDRLPIVLEMTCYTGQFTYLSTTGTTLDERFQRQPNGGAIAVMAPSGLSVATGHHFLLEGFHQYLNSKPRFQSKLGELMEASYFNLFQHSTCCQDVRYTFLLLGDPLTTALVQAPDLMYLPVVQK